VLIGHRLLKKIESQMLQQNCVRIMISIPEIRDSMIQWAVNRDFVDVKTVPYPFEAVGQVMVKDTSLVIFQKPLKKILPKPPSHAATTSVSYSSTSGIDATATFGVAGHAAEAVESKGESSTPPLPPPAPGKVALPPHWRAMAGGDMSAPMAESSSTQGSS
jgi:hypothetical protein